MWLSWNHVHPWTGRERLPNMLCLRITWWLSFAGVGPLMLIPGSNFMKGRGQYLNIYGPVSALSLHLHSLPLQQQIGQHPRISCFLPAAQMFSHRHERGTLLLPLDMHMYSGCESGLFVHSFPEVNHICKRSLKDLPKAQYLRNWCQMPTV